MSYLSLVGESDQLRCLDVLSVLGLIFNYVSINCVQIGMSANHFTSSHLHWCVCGFMLFGMPHPE